ncbi:MAG: serine hydrolase [Pirellulaceae bacterium]|nr:serine hydrolase [Pirellulaceae bacterium]
MRRPLSLLTLLVLLMVLLSFGSQLLAAGPERQDPLLQNELARIVKRYELPGMVAAVIWKGRVCRMAASGVRKMGESVPITVDDKIHLGSCTKAMTATLLATLVEQQKVAWDAVLPQLLPNLKDVMHESYRDVSLKQLLIHRSGLPANSARMFLVGKEKSPTEQRRELFRTVLAQPPQNVPGTEYLYSNLGYMLAGLVAEESTGESWESLMSTRIFRPLGMETAGFGAPGTLGEIDQPWGHDESPRLGLRPLQRDNPSILGPAGTVHASLGDWGKFVALHLKHQPIEQIIENQTIDELHQLEPQHKYTMGWISVPREWADGNALTHTGSNTMWMAVVWLAPAKDLAFLAVTNSGQQVAGKACDQSIRFMLESFSPQFPCR